jgi:hypothetical protein
LPVSPTQLHLLVNILVVVCTSPMHATWITQLILNFISLMFCEEYRLWKLLFKHFFPPTFKHSPWHCSQTPSVCVLPSTLWWWNFAPTKDRGFKWLPITCVLLTNDFRLCLIFSAAHCALTYTIFLHQS